MNSTTSRHDSQTVKLATFLGAASLLASTSTTAQPQQTAQSQVAREQAPEDVLITGSLIRGAASVGELVTSLGPEDFVQAGALTTAELFKTVPAALALTPNGASASNTRVERGTRVNLRELDLPSGTRSLMMVDGVRVPSQGEGLCELDPSIIPVLSQDHIDVLLNGASATYGSDAIVGVVNIVLKRGYDGAVTQLRYTMAQGGKNRYLASQLWGRTWDGGDITLSYEWYDDSPILGKAHSNVTLDHSAWGLDNRTPLSSSMPGTLSTGAPSATLGTQCQNCWAIPHGTGGNFDPGATGIGPTAPFSASTLNWGTFNAPANAGTNGVRNEFNPYLIAWLDAAQQRNGGAITVDQRLTDDIQFYGEAFYSNRRAEYVNPSHISPSFNDDLTVGVPTFNPYYPTGGAPTNLRVSYNMGVEHPSLSSAYELAGRYMGGLHFVLPKGWNGDLYYTETYDANFNQVEGTVNKNAISAALGWTIAATSAQGTTPAIATWTRPANVPYLNLFCDASAFQCNSPQTLAFVTGVRQFSERYWINEKGAKFDGPLFDLPAGTIKGAVGGTYTSSRLSFVDFDSTSSPNLIAPMLADPQSRQVWAGFAQVNVPIFGDAYNLPLLRSMVLEASWRHDQYSDVGGTSNPKISLDWTPSEDIGLTFRGSWGTNFRAPGFGETSMLAKFITSLWNANDLLAQNVNVAILAGADRGSAADRLVNPSSTNSIPGLIGYVGGINSLPPGIGFLGSAKSAASFHFRDYLNTEGQTLRPETSIDWNVGAELAPRIFVKGLDVQASWYSIRIDGALGNFANPTSNAFNAGRLGFSYIVPTDLAYLHQAPGDLQCHNNNTPASADPISSITAGCPEFEQAITGMFSNGRNAVPTNSRTRVLWINDGGIFNKGILKADGIDWTASYDFELGDLGAWNTGIVGTYYLHRRHVFRAESLFPGNHAAPFGEDSEDDFHQTLAAVGNVQQNGVAADVQGPMHYRARLGWSNEAWNITAFVNFDSHFFHTQQAPPNVNGQCATSGGIVGGGTFPCAIEGYTNIVPSSYLFDLSVGYDTGDEPANEYLRHVGVQLVVQNVMGKHPAYEYRVGGGSTAAFNISQSDQGRTVSLIVTKTW